VYAAYGGVFIVLSILWGWGIDKKAPDLYDWNGALICLAGASINFAFRITKAVFSPFLF
jgi:small multidrug resistance family-3 protein